MDEIVYISTITPVYRGCRTLAALVDELNVVRRQLVNNGGPVRLAEAIFVDDASEDGSGEALYALAREHEWIRVVTLSRNFGQHAATMAGILHASGDWIVTLDEDLQHHPRFILSLLERAVSGQHDIVYARPQTPPHKSVYRDASSALYKRVLGKLSGNPHVSMFNSFRMIRGSVARGASAVAADQTYFDVAVGWFTSRVSTLELPLVDVRYAEERESGYGWRTLLSHARRMLMSSDIKVVRGGAIAGFVAMGAAGVAVAYTVILKLLGDDVTQVPGWASVFVAVLFWGGLNAFLTGLVLENLSVVLMQAHGKPTFFEIDRRKDEIVQDWLRTRS